MASKQQKSGKTAVQMMESSLCVLNDALQDFHTADVSEAFVAILRRAGEHLDAERAVLFENDESRCHCRMVYEWHRDAMAPLAAGGEVLLSYQSDLQMPNAQAWTPGADTTLPLPGLGIPLARVYPVMRGSRPYGLLCFGYNAGPKAQPGGAGAFLPSVANLLGALLVRKDYEESIRRMAYHDQLTGLMNRYRFDVYLQRALNDVRGNGGQGYVLFIDMDDFKIINDGYGHDYGDALLTEVAGFLSGRFGECAKLFRFGGDEFVVLIERRHAAEAQRVVEDILMRARRPWVVMDREFYCTLSIGVARYPDGADGVTEIVKNADIALYQAKDMGKNNCVFYNRSLNDRSLQRAETERKMRAAIEDNCRDFWVYYQPLVNRQGKVIGAEALLRWRDGSTLVPPGDFIPLAEYLGLIV